MIRRGGMCHAIAMVLSAAVSLWLSTAATAAALTMTPSPIPTPLPTLNECNPSSPECPVGTECYCCCGAFRCAPPFAPCCAIPCLSPMPTATPTPTPVIIGIGDVCEPGRVCPPPLVCLIDPPHQTRVCSCVGDCDENAEVTVDELVTLVNVALGNMAVSACPLGDAAGDGTITVDEILRAVNSARYDCGAPLPTPTPTPQCSSVPCGGHCAICPPCTSGTNCPPCELGVCALNPFNGCQCQSVPPVTPTVPPTPVLYHGHICCECRNAVCMDLPWVEVEPTCPLGCQTFTGAECEAPCHGGPQGGPAACVSLTPCTADTDCDDGNGCTADLCTLDGCTHACGCV